MGEAHIGMWSVFLINTTVILVVALGFYQPSSARDWRALRMFSGFIVALFLEMYGFPLTVFLLAGLFGSRYPGLTVGQGGGHLWSDLIGWTADPRLSPFHLASYIGIAAGFGLLASSWRVLWSAQRSGEIARTGPYLRVRHPQYAGFLLIMTGFLLQWPTIATLITFPILLARYRRLALDEERTIEQLHGDRWVNYANATPRLIPQFPGARTRRARAAGSARESFLENSEPEASDVPAEPLNKPAIR